MNIRLLLFLLIFASGARAQGSLKSGMPGGAQKVISPDKDAAINLSSGGMINALNGQPVKNISPKDMAALQNGQETLQNVIEKQRNDYVYGSTAPRSYQIRYSSAPVKKLYDEFVTPLATNADFILSNHNFVDIVTDLMLKDIADRGLYTAPGAYFKLAEAIRNVTIKIDVRHPDAVKDNTPQFPNRFYEKALSEILEATKGLLSQEKTYHTYQAPQMGMYPDDYLSYITTSTSEFSRAGEYFSQKAANTCITAARFSKSFLSDLLFGDQYTRAMKQAVKGELFKPIRSLKGKSSEYEVYSIGMTGLENHTRNGTMSALWDKECNCPSILTFSVFQAQKIKNAEVYNP